MKKIFYLLFITMLFQSVLFSQDNEWGIQAYGLNSDANASYSQDVEKDAQGNIYMAGVFVGNVVFGTDTLTAISQFPGLSLPDGFLAKYSPNGDFVWVEQFETPNQGEVFDIEIDELGNIYLFGYFVEIMTIGGTSINSSGPGDGAMYVAKLNPQRELEWANVYEHGPGFGFAFGHAMELGRNGDLFFSGSFDGMIDFGGTVLEASTEANDGAYFLGRLSTDSGNEKWVKHSANAWPQAIDPYYPKGSDLASDDDSNIYITGSVYGLSELGGITLDATNLGRTMFLSKYDSTGTIQWVRSSVGEQYVLTDAAEGVAVDHSTGDIYITGVFQSTTFDLGQGFVLMNSPSFNDVFFIVKYNSSGEIQWAKQSDATTRIAVGIDIDVSPDGGILVVGHHSDNNNNPIVLGEGNNTSNLPPVLGGTDIFIAKFLSNGDLDWAKHANGTGEQIATSLIPLGDNQIAFTGQFRDQLILGNSTLNTTPTSTSLNMFLGKCDGDLDTRIFDFPINNLSFQIAPNPASNFLQIEIQDDLIKNNFQIEAIDLMGKVLSQYDLRSSNQLISTSEFSNGIYFLRISGNGFYGIQKFIIQK